MIDVSKSNDIRIVECENHSQIVQRAFALYNPKKVLEGVLKCGCVEGTGWLIRGVGSIELMREGDAGDLFVRHPRSWNVIGLSIEEPINTHIGCCRARLVLALFKH